MTAYRDVLLSRWAVSKLLWNEEDGWLWVFDRPLGRLEDAEVLAKYGDEAFRRRDELISSGDRVYEPQDAELIGRRVVEALRSVGWSIEADGFRELRAVRGNLTLEVDGSVSGRLPLHVPGRSFSPATVGEAERLLLIEGVGAEAMSHLDEIMSVAMVNGRRADKGWTDDPG